MAIPGGLISLGWVSLCAVLVPLLLGLGLVRRLGLCGSAGLRVNLAWSYLVGQLAASTVTGGWLLLGQPFGGWIVALVNLALAALLLRRPSASGEREPRPPRPPGRSRHWPQDLPRHWVWPPLALAVLLLVETGSRVGMMPLVFGDESAIWAAKAKALYAAPAGELREALHLFVQHPDYPLWNPLVQVQSFAAVGRVLHWENRVPIQAFGIALLLLFSAAATRRCHPLLAGVALLALLSTELLPVATSAGADVMLALSTLAAVDALLRARETGDPTWWRLACVALAAMLLSKNEGAMLALVVVSVFGLRWLLDRRSDPAPLRPTRALWLLLPLAALLVHRGFNSAFGVYSGLMMARESGGLFERIVALAAERVPQVLSFYGGYLLDPARSRWLPLLLLALGGIGVVAHRRRFFGRPEALLLAVFVLGVAGYMLVFVGTNSSLQWHLETAADRTVLHVLPLAALGVCVAAWPRGCSAAGAESATATPA